jgi:uncharacterized protein (DUF2267 family)
MPTSGLRQFDATVHKTNEWLQDLMLELHTDDRQAAYRALRAVLHALRDRLTMEEAVDLAAQLPMLVRGFYYEGWQPAHMPSNQRTAKKFLEHVRVGYAPDGSANVEHIVRAVFRVLERHVTGGELEDVRRCLPEELRQLWD